MRKVRNIFLTRQWPWHVLSGLCLLLGLALLLREKPGCADITVLNDDLTKLGHAMDDCCRCAYKPGRGIIGELNPDVPVEEEVIISEEEIEERLEEAGGEADGEMTISLAWNSTDDIDLHIHEPSGVHIYHAAKRSPSGGRLDVDANGPNSTLGRSPVENVTWEDPANGLYKVTITSYTLNESRDGSLLPATMRILKNGVTEMRSLNLIVRQRPTDEGAPIIESFTVAYP